MAATRQKARPVGVTADPKRPFSERNGKLMIPAEAADYLGVSERQVWRLIGRKDLPRVKVGKLVRVHIDDLDAYIDARRKVG